MGGRLCMCGDRVYKKSLYFLLSFAMNLKLLLKKLSPFFFFFYKCMSPFSSILKQRASKIHGEGNKQHGSTIDCGKEYALESNKNLRCVGKVGPDGEESYKSSREVGTRF